MNGLEVAKVISNLLPDTFFVFVTGYTKYAVDSFAVHPFDYIIKPVNKDRISEVITKIAKRLNNSTISKKANMLTLKNKDETYFVHPRDIIFFERQSRDTLVHTKHGVFTINENLTDLETNLFDNFLRVHQSFLINLNKVKMIKNLTNRSYEIEFVGYNKKAFLSRYKYDEFKEKFAPLL
jgi:two-component system LytT family response regulator